MAFAGNSSQQLTSLLSRVPPFIFSLFVLFNSCFATAYSLMGNFASALSVAYSLMENSASAFIAVFFGVNLSSGVSLSSTS